MEISPKISLNSGHRFCGMGLRHMLTSLLRVGEKPKHHVYQIYLRQCPIMNQPLSKIFKESTFHLCSALTPSAGVLT
jgi:hypothetical protein